MIEVGVILGIYKGVLLSSKKHEMYMVVKHEERVLNLINLNLLYLLVTQQYTTSINSRISKYHVPMASYIQIYASSLIMAFMIASMVYASPNISRNNDIDAAIEEMERANYFTFVMLINMVPSDLFQGNVTFLVPSDKSLSRITIPPNNVTDLLLRHSIPSPLLFDHFLHLPTNSMLPTSNPELMVKVNNSGRRGLFLGNVRIVSPNVCTHGYSVRCHGIDSVLNVDDEQRGLPLSVSCPRIISPIPLPITVPAAAAAPSLAPPSLAPAADPPQSETSGGGRPHLELALAFMSFVSVLFIVYL